MCKIQMRLSLSFSSSSLDRVITRLVPFSSSSTGSSKIKGKKQRRFLMYKQQTSGRGDLFFFLKNFSSFWFSLFPSWKEKEKVVFCRDVCAPSFPPSRPPGPIHFGQEGLLFAFCAANSRRDRDLGGLVLSAWEEQVMMSRSSSFVPLRTSPLLTSSTCVLFPTGDRYKIRAGRYDGGQSTILLFTNTLPPLGHPTVLEAWRSFW